MQQTKKQIRDFMSLTEKDRLRILELHKQHSVNHIVFLMNYRYSADVVNQVLRDEIERLKVENARFQLAHDGLLAEIDKLAKHDMAVGVALRETREALAEWGGLANHLGLSTSNHRRRTESVLARHADFAGEADHG